MSTALVAAATSALGQLADGDPNSAGAITWSSPVPAFGDPGVASVATVGINPSNREFVDNEGVELTGRARRLHTLRSLELSEWSEADTGDIIDVASASASYFHRAPYREWFGRLEYIVSVTGASYYGGPRQASHLDLVPFATAEKWGNLDPVQRTRLLKASADAFVQMLCDSTVELLILNGRSVVTAFEGLLGEALIQEDVPGWRLPRADSAHVVGTAFVGVIDNVRGIPLNRQVAVLGYNHNLQSSFGVTQSVLLEIRRWVSRRSAALLRW